MASRNVEEIHECSTSSDGELCINTSENEEDPPLDDVLEEPLDNTSDDSSDYKGLKIKQEFVNECEPSLNSHDPDLDIDIEYNPVLVKNELISEDSIEVASTTNSAPYKCTSCPYETSDATYLSVHKKTHRYKFSCDSCHYICGSASKLSYHQKKRHMKLEDLLFYCGDCPYTTLIRKELVLHRRKEHKRLCLKEKKSICPKCPYKAMKKVSLIRHQGRAHNDPIFECVVCRKPFLFEEELKDHLESHSYDFNLRRYGVFQCRLCDFSTKVQRVIVKHNIEVHKMISES